MRLSVFSDYSMRVLMYAAVKGEELSTTKEVGEYFKISYNHLVKVVHKLSSVGLIDVQQGRGGGFRLAKSPESIHLGDVVRLMEPDFFMVECHNKAENKCVITPFCRLKGVIDQGLNVFVARLDQSTIADMVKENKKSW